MRNNQERVTAGDEEGWEVEKDTWTMEEIKRQSQGWNYMGGRITKTLCWCLCSMTVKRHHDQDNLGKKAFNWGLPYSVKGPS